jgi:(4S)-4-hydroxy-5-phosphonooxypentane-2,3-dione isomerase
MSQMILRKASAAALLTSALVFVSANESIVVAQPAPRYAASAVDLEISPDQIEAFIAALKENAAATIQEPGCRQYDVLQSPANPNQIFIYEVYENGAAVEAHRASEHFKKYLATTGKMVVKRQSRPMTSIVRNVKPN